MAGRGRGRGKGKGATNKALVEQLGLQKNELIKEPAIEPPETFPSLQFRPVKVTEERALDRSYMVVVKKELREHLQNSEYHIALDTKKPDIERYSDRFHCLNNKPRLELCWSRFPKELKPAPPVVGSRRDAKGKRKAKAASENPKKKQPKKENINIKEKLEELEKKEVTGDEEKKDEDEPEELLEELEEDGDYEMDEGTDYINNYFDNGEGYIEDDGDALEEGGVF